MSTRKPNQTNLTNVSSAETASIDTTPFKSISVKLAELQQIERIAYSIMYPVVSYDSDLMEMRQTVIDQQIESAREIRAILSQYVENVNYDD